MELIVAGRELVPVALDAVEKREAIGKLAEALGRRHGLAEEVVSELRQAALRREAALSTGMEKGVAVPHGLLPGDAPELLLLAGVLRRPVEWGTIDGSPVRIVILFAVPEGRVRDYQRALGDVMGLLIDPAKRRALVRRVDEGLST